MLSTKGCCYQLNLFAFISFLFLQYYFLYSHMLCRAKLCLLEIPSLRTLVILSTLRLTGLSHKKFVSTGIIIIAHNVLVKC